MKHLFCYPENGKYFLFPADLADYTDLMTMKIFNRKRALAKT